MSTSGTRPGRGSEEEPRGETGRIFRLERALGFREPEEYNAATRAFFVVIFLAVLVMAVLSAMRAQPLALALVRLAPFGVLLALVPQAAGDLLYHKNRRLSAILRVVARLVLTPVVLMMYVVLMYAAHGVWSALFTAGLTCAAISGLLLLGRLSGPRRPRGPI